LVGGVVENNPLAERWGSRGTFDAEDACHVKEEVAKRAPGFRLVHLSHGDASDGDGAVGHQDVVVGLNNSTTIGDMGGVLEDRRADEGSKVRVGFRYLYEEGFNEVLVVEVAFDTDAASFRWVEFESSGCLMEAANWRRIEGAERSWVVSCAKWRLYKAVRSCSASFWMHHLISDLILACRSSRKM
jgi:hypothetical protein